MPTATLKYNLATEADLYNFAAHGRDWARVVRGMEATLRDWWKHEREFPTPAHVITAARQRLQELLDDHNLSLDMIP